MAIGMARRGVAAASWITLAGCVAPPQPIVPAAPSLNAHWVVGVEPVREDAPFLLPATARLITALSAMPNVQVYYLGTQSDHNWFSAAQVPKLRIYGWLHGQGTCMTFTYTAIYSGHQSAPYGQNVYVWPVGGEPDPVCVDRAATQLYQSMVTQGL